MIKRAGLGRGGRVGLITAAVAALCLVVAGLAVANNLDRRTATNAAKQVAKGECRQTTGCSDFFARRMHRVSRHKAIGKIAVAGTRHGVGFVCVRQIVIKLDHYSGRITYATSTRRCKTTN